MRFKLDFEVWEPVCYVFFAPHPSELVNLPPVFMMVFVVVVACTVVLKLGVNM